MNCILFILSVASALAQLRPGDPASIGISRAGLDRVHAMLESEVREGRVGAASILIARRGTIVLNNGYGHPSQDAGSPATEPDSVFLVASITKPVTSTAVMMLGQIEGLFTFRMGLTRKVIPGFGSPSMADSFTHAWGQLNLNHCPDFRFSAIGGWEFLSP